MAFSNLTNITVIVVFFKCLLRFTIQQTTKNSITQTSTILRFDNIYPHPTTKLRVGNVFSCVCLFTSLFNDVVNNTWVCYCLFTLHRNETRTSTGNRTGTIGNNLSWSLSLVQTSLTYLMTHLMLPIPPVNRQTPVKTLPSRNFVCGR